MNLQTFPPPPGTGMMTDSDTSHVVQLESMVKTLSELTRDLALSSPHSGQGPPSCVGRKKMKDKQEKNPQAMLEESDGQYRDHVNFLEEASAQDAGVVNLQTSPALWVVAKLKSKVSGKKNSPSPSNLMILEKPSQHPGQHSYI